MYQFPEELKQAYEHSPLSFVYYQSIDDRAVPVLVSDGFCRNIGMCREAAVNWLRIGLFERIHPDDVGLLTQVSEGFLRHREPYDIVFRCRIEPVISDAGAEAEPPHYSQIHGLGQWQIMPDGTELAVITYANLSATREVTTKKLEAYELFRRDRFYTDPLTGLPNVNYLHEFGAERVHAIRADGKTPCVVYVDVYSMRSYNEQYGVEEGDRLLCLTAETLRAQFPKALIIRGSDDHFIMIPCTNDEAELEQRLILTGAAVRREARGNTLGVRSGVCPLHEDMTLNEAIDHARCALKQIEDDINREVAFYSQAADEIYRHSRYIVENLDRAIRDNWIRVFCHELYRIESQKIAAFESLARWVDPQRGLLSPQDFVPTLRKYHQLFKLDLCVFEQVCRGMKRWHDSGLPLMPVSVNFSRQDFDHADIVSEMNRIYDRHRLAEFADKSYFIIEITEQDLAVGTDRLREQLEQIRRSGYRLWLDDFGSGYSGINVFSRFDFDLIKCDMELLRRLNDHGSVNRLILETLVTTARKLGVHILIEGLETEEHLAFVREIGCELVQGFYYHKPEPFDELLQRFLTTDAAAACETPQEREALGSAWLQNETKSL